MIGFKIMKIQTAKAKTEKRIYIAAVTGRPIHFKGEESIEDVIKRHNATVRQRKRRVLENTGEKPQ